jgi:hypothetical protein
MNEDELHAANLAYISDPTVRSAYDSIVQSLRRHGLRISVLETSSARPARMYAISRGQEHYTFSCNRARRHLSFYIRKKALELWPHLASQAAKRFADTRVQGEQTVIVVRSAAEAQTLIKWLLESCRWD